MRTGARRKATDAGSGLGGRTPRDTPASAPSNWWASYFDDQYLLEYEPLFTPERDRREVARLLDILGLPAGARVLDCPCGQGRHATLLAEAGFEVDGVDYSSDLLAIARKESLPRNLRYRKADMRKLPIRWKGRFDVVVNLFTSFGFFLDARDDRKVLAEFSRVLADGGRLIWHGGSRDGVMARFLERDWWQVEDGTMVAHERSFDPLSGFLTVHSTWQGRKRGGEREHRIRLYTADRLAEMCASVGLVVEEAWDGWNDRPLHRRSTEMLLVARKE
ncbi:MAG TPA: methyltransferase domain-containing protein [Gemmatimonadales bacterium]|nr:methyltransferase domain-containing protein [Gemmatimonadales bacterium]